MAKAQIKKAPEGKTLISVYVPLAQLDKLKQIAHREGTDYAQVYNKAFDKLIELYEGKHGKIKPLTAGKGLNSL